MQLSNHKTLLLRQTVQDHLIAMQYDMLIMCRCSRSIAAQLSPPGNQDKEAEAVASIVEL